MKSAYELALERMEKQGIERPREENFSDELQEKIAEAKRKAEARIAELEILHKNRLKTMMDPGKRQEEEEEYVRERRRIEDDRERKIEELRGRGRIVLPFPAPARASMPGLRENSRVNPTHMIESPSGGFFD